MAAIQLMIALVCQLLLINMSNDSAMGQKMDPKDKELLQHYARVNTYFYENEDYSSKSVRHPVINLVEGACHNHNLPKAVSIQYRYGGCLELFTQLSCKGDSVVTVGTCCTKIPKTYPVFFNEEKKQRVDISVNETNFKSYR